MNQTIYTSEAHAFPAQLVDKDALYIMEKLRNAGHLSYLVGGSVRDLLLNHPPKDYDISTAAKPEEIRYLFRNCILIGRRFRLAHIRFGKKIFEVSTFRAGNNESDTLILRDNEWGSPEEDALRRDFTINGLFYDPFSHTIVDYVGGFHDLQKHCLRTIGHPFSRFKQDPVRMIRLLKFQARFGFEIDPEALVALLECRAEITKSASARVLEELLRMLESGSAHPFFTLMAQHGLLQLILPALTEFLDTTAGKEIFSCLEEIDRIFRSASQALMNRAVCLSGLVFPCVQQRIKERYLVRGKIPHLGEIQKDTFQVLEEIFHLYCRLPRRLKHTIAGIVLAQYRLTPLTKRKPSRMRIPTHDPDFLLALQFLQIRACLEPGLQMICDEWNRALAHRAEDGAHRPKRTRRPPLSPPLDPLL